MKRVLLIESDPGLRAELRRSIESAGYAVDAETSWNGAARVIRRGGVDALLAGFDEASDVAALTRLLEDGATPPVLAFVTPRSLALSLTLLQRGVQTVLRKPFDLDRLESELASILAVRPREPGDRSEFITRDPETLAALRLADAMANRDTTLVIQGESGTGKTRLALRTHSRRSGARALHRVSLDEGATTRAQLAAAEHAGTLLLSELHRATAESQGALAEWLAALDDGPSERDTPRIIATTQRSIRECVDEGTLRPDLAHRLDVVTLRLPPLRERLCDLTALIRHFSVVTGTFDEASIRCSPESLARLAEHPFRGNVRELENRVRRLTALRPAPPIEAGLLLEPDLASSVRAEDPRRRSLKELEREAIERSLARHGNNRTRASRELGISVRTLRNKLQRYGA